MLIGIGIAIDCLIVTIIVFKEIRFPRFKSQGRHFSIIYTPRSIPINTYHMVRQVGIIGKRGETTIQPINPCPYIMFIGIRSFTVLWNRIFVHQGCKHVRFHIVFVGNTITDNRRKNNDCLIITTELLTSRIAKVVQFVIRVVTMHIMSHIAIRGQSTRRITHVAEDINRTSFPSTCVIAVSNTKHDDIRANMVVVINSVREHIQRADNVTYHTRTINGSPRISIL